jgi:hypothetical protein
MVDNLPNPGDNSGTVRDLLRDLCSGRLRAAPRADSTGSVGSRTRGSHPPARSLESLPILTEDELLRGYGLDPNDLELERIDRPMRFDSSGTLVE